jgi:nucleoside-diphosphate-sugar epimerase
MDKGYKIETTYKTADPEKIQEIMNKKLIIDHKPARKGDQEKTSAVIDKARKLLGYEPKVTFKIGLEQQVQWYLDKFTS